MLPYFLSTAALAQSWLPQQSGTSASLRGVSAVSEKVAWASGGEGTYLETINGGKAWRAAKVPGAEALDFRAVHGVDSRTAYLLSSGAGDKSRIYKTTDSGKNWTLQLTNPDPKGFYDALAFWDATHGIVLGDPVDGHFAILTTGDGGGHWSQQQTPPALPAEGAFAASGSCLIVRGKSEAWFGTGGPKAARVFHSEDGGQSWSTARTPIRSDSASAGIFSLAFSEKQYGIAVGGDYNKPKDRWRNIAATADGGRTWDEPASVPPDGFRSAVAYLPDRHMWIAVGTSGSDYSANAGATWLSIDNGAYNAVSFVPGKGWSHAAGWAVGPKGRIAKFQRP